MVLWLHFEEGGRLERIHRLVSGAAPDEWSALGRHWLDAFEEPLKSEPLWPYQGRDEKKTRLFGA